MSKSRDIHHELFVVEVFIVEANDWQKMQKSVCDLHWGYIQFLLTIADYMADYIADLVSKYSRGCEHF